MPNNEYIFSESLEFMYVYVSGSDLQNGIDICFNEVYIAPKVGTIAVAHAHYSV